MQLYYKHIILFSIGGSPQTVDQISKITPISDLLNYKGCLSVECQATSNIRQRKEKKKLLSKYRIPPFHTTCGRRYKDCPWNGCGHVTWPTSKDCESLYTHETRYIINIYRYQLSNFHTVSQGTQDQKLLITRLTKLHNNNSINLPFAWQWIVTPVVFQLYMSSQSVDQMTSQYCTKNILQHTTTASNHYAASVNGQGKNLLAIVFS